MAPGEGEPTFGNLLVRAHRKISCRSDASSSEVIGAAAARIGVHGHLRKAVQSMVHPAVRKRKLQIAVNLQPGRGVCRIQVRFSQPDLEVASGKLSSGGNNPQRAVMRVDHVSAQTGHRDEARLALGVQGCLQRVLEHKLFELPARSGERFETGGVANDREGAIGLGWVELRADADALRTGWRLVRRAIHAGAAHSVHGLAEQPELRALIPGIRFLRGRIAQEAKLERDSADGAFLDLGVLIRVDILIQLA